MKNRSSFAKLESRTWAWPIGALALSLGVSACTNKDATNTDASASAAASGSAKAAQEASIPDDSCKEADSTKITMKSFDKSGVCLMLPEGVKAGPGKIDNTNSGEQKFVAADNSVIATVTWHVAPMPDLSKTLSEKANDPDVEILSKGPLPGRVNSDHFAARRKSFGSEQIMVNLAHGTFLFSCSAAGNGDLGPRNAAVCKSMSPLGPVPTLATDGVATADATSSASAPGADGGLAEGNYSYYDSSGGGGSGHLKPNGKDFVISYSGSTTGGTLSCKAAGDVDYKCSWSDSSGGGSASFKRTPEGNLKGSWSGSGGGGGWVFTRSKK